MVDMVECFTDKDEFKRRLIELRDVAKENGSVSLSSEELEAMIETVSDLENWIDDLENEIDSFNR